MEIKTQDLRLNNLFVDRKGQICKVERIEEKFEECKIVSDTGLTHLPVEPIQLTEEVLLRCGFVHQFKSYKQDFFSLNIDELIYLTFDLRKNRITLHSYLLGVIKTFDYNYLYQLQNLFHSLKNEELTYNHSPSI